MRYMETHKPASLATPEAHVYDPSFVWTRYHTYAKGRVHLLLLRNWLSDVAQLHQVHQPGPTRALLIDPFMQNRS